MSILIRLIPIPLMAPAMAVAAIAGVHSARNPAAANGVAMIGLLIIAFCGAFAIFGIVLGVAQAIQQRLDERPLWSGRRRDQVGHSVAHPHF